MQVYPVSNITKANLSNFAVILVNPLYPENIGASARACANFGVPNLIVVNPHDLNELKMKAMATNIGKDVLSQMKIFHSLQEALQDFNFVVGTTGKLGRKRLTYETVYEIAPYLCELSFNNKIAILFGNERTGLSNEELSFCDRVITIPTTENASLNVSQAVVIVLYEIFKNAGNPVIFKPKLANKKELDTMYKILEVTLEEIDYIPHENKVLWMTNIKRLLSKMELTSKEVKIIQGFCRQLLWRLGKKLTLPSQEEKQPQSDKSEETCQKSKVS